ncbi:hypothetical protein H4R34_003091, partial [Dimargaris verticillata]
MGLTNWFTLSSSTPSSAPIDAKTCTAEEQRDPSSALPAPRPASVTALAHPPGSASSKVQRASTVSLAPSSASTETTLSDERTYDHHPRDQTASLPLESALAMNDHDKEVSTLPPESTEPPKSSTSAWFGLWGSSAAPSNTVTTDSVQLPETMPPAGHAEEALLSVAKTEASARSQSLEASSDSTSPRRSHDSPAVLAARPRTQSTTSMASGTNSNRSSGLFAYFWPEKAEHEGQLPAPLPSQPTARNDLGVPDSHADVADASALPTVSQASNSSLAVTPVFQPTHAESPKPTANPDSLAQASTPVSSIDHRPSIAMDQQPPIIVYPASPTAAAPEPQVSEEATATQSTGAPMAQSDPAVNPLLATLPATNSVWRYLFSRPQALGPSAPRALLSAQPHPSPAAAATNATAAQPIANGGDAGIPISPCAKPGRPASVYSTISQASRPSPRKLARQATPRKGAQTILTQTTSPSAMVSTTTVSAVATGSTASAAAAVPAELTVPKVNYVFPTADHMTAVVHAQRLQWNHHLQQQTVAMAPHSSHPNPFHGMGIRERSQSLWQSVVHTVTPYVASWVPALAHRLDQPLEPSSQSCPPSLLRRPSTENAVQSLKMADLMSQPSDWERPMKNVVIIGVHGWFPMKVVSRILGEPTGTSSKFCEMMYESLLTYLRQRSQRQAQTCSVCGHFTNLAALAESQRTAMTEGLDIDPNYYGNSDHDGDDGLAASQGAKALGHVPSLVDELESVSLIPLVGEGKIEDRVEVLWQQLVESDMAFQQAAMRTIPLVRRAWHQDSANDMVWLPATVRTQIQVTKKSREHRSSASKRRPERAATENGRHLHKPSQDLSTTADHTTAADIVHYAATVSSPTLMASKSALESYSSDHGYGGSTPAPSVRETLSSSLAAQAELVGDATLPTDLSLNATSSAQTTHQPSAKRKRAKGTSQAPRRYICPRCLRGHISTGTTNSNSDSPATTASTRARKGSS